MSGSRRTFVRPDLAHARYRWQDNIPDGRVSRFDMNTLPVSPAYWPAIAARVAKLDSCSYPDATYPGLRRALGRYLGMEPAQIIPAAGCDEVLQLSAILATGRGDTALVAQPTYQMYAVAAQAAGATLEALEPTAGLRLDLAGLVARAASARIVFVCSPNNPTAEEVPPDVIAALCDACPGLVVADQAYVEFGGTDLASLVAEHENLVIGRTLSKGWGLAALRVGYAIAAPSVAAALDALRPPGSISLQSAVAAELALAEDAAMRADCTAFVIERQRLAGGLRDLGLDVIGEAGSFVTFAVDNDAAEAFAYLAQRRLVVRTFPHSPLLRRVLRASIATPPENDALLDAVATYTGREPADTPPSAAPAAVFARRATAERVTRETAITASLVVDGTGRVSVATGLGFLDHMLTALAFHALVDLELTCNGDLDVDAHHTLEDVGIALGEALDRALGGRSGLRRFGDAGAPLDEALAWCVVDLSGRGVSSISLGLSGTPIGGVAATLWPHMLESFARAARLNLHLSSTGTDDHHTLEAAFKALALALRAACSNDPRRAASIPSTKGVL